MSDAAELEHFRSEVRAFLKAELSPELAERVQAGYYLSKEELMRWHRALDRRGWIATSHWPVEHGGQGWSPMQRYIFEDELAAAGAPILLMQGLNQVASLLIPYGTPEQKKHLKGIREGTEMWCQGWSESEAGSDLANLRCPAVREGDHYVVNGRKLWTTVAHWADWCLLLVRTSRGERKQEGITILILDMKAPGITVRPIIGLDGMHSLNELILDNVRVPVDCRVGEEGRGWDIMKIVLGTERISAASIWKCKAMFARLTAIARREIRSGRPLVENPRFRERLAWLEMRMRALEVILLRILELPPKQVEDQACMLKLRGTELQQDILEMTSEAAGQYAIPFDPDVLRNGWEGPSIGPDFAAPATPFYLFWRKATISGGASEVMRNIIAQEVMGK